MQRAGGALSGSLARFASLGAGWLAGCRVWAAYSAGLLVVCLGGGAVGARRRLARLVLRADLTSRSKGFFVGVLFLVFFSPMYW